MQWVSSRAAILVALLCLLFLPGSVTAAAPVGQQTIRVHIPAECRREFYGPDIPGFQHPEPDDLDWNPLVAKPMVFMDRRTAIFFYVESDGRHLAAIDSNGKLLWVRSPFEDAELCPYRSPRPVIRDIQAADVPAAYGPALWGPAASPRTKALGMDPAHMFLRISFDSSQFGLIDETTGNFLFEGQN